MGKRTGRKPKFTAKQFIDAMPGTYGILAALARKMGCCWNTAQYYIDNHPTIKQAYENECAGVDDMAETTVIKAIHDGDVGTARWWLEKRRRDKFPTESRVQVTGQDGGPIQIATFDYNRTVAALGQIDHADSQLATTEA